MWVIVSDKYGCTLLHWATLKGHLDVAKFLASKGANVNAEDILGRKPIHFAVINDHRNIIEFLLDKGIIVNSADKQGHTPLHWASWSGHLDMVKYLIDKGANINAKCEADRTPLDIARGRGHSNIVKYLEEKLNQEREKPVQRRRRHHHGDHNRHQNHLSRKTLAIDSSNQPEIAASGSTRPSSWINDLFGWAKEKSGKLISGLYGDTIKELENSKSEDIQTSLNNQRKSKQPSYDQAQEMEFQYMSKYDARKSNDKNAGAYSKKHGNDRQVKQQYGSKMGNEQSVNQSRVVGNERQQKLGVLHNGPKPTLSHHSNKNHSYFDGQPKKISERKEHIVNYKQCDNSSYKHSNQHKPMISANNKWSERISNERIDSRKMIGGANQKQQGFHKNQQSSHNSKHAHLTRATAQVDVPSTLFALNMLAMKATNQKFNNTPLPKKIQKRMLHAEKVRAETLGRKVGGRIEGTLWFTK